MTISPHKILVCITEDWFAASHFLPLLETLVGLGADTAVVTRVGSKRAEIEATGARVIPFDWQRGSLRPFLDARTALKLAGVVRAERPDVIHAIALKPIALSMAARAAHPASRLAVHLTGVGYAGTVGSGSAAYLHGAVQRLLARRLRSRSVHLFAENPDDVARLRGFAKFPLDHATILGGAGVDPDKYPTQPISFSGVPVAGFLGRLVWSKGVDVLIAAHEILKTRGVRLNLLIGGTPDPENPRSVTAAQIKRWSGAEGVVFRGRVDDIPAFWRDSTFAVVPSRGGEGLPRALIESSACGRAAIVSDVPGCRYFVRDGEEGLIVPPDDAKALADALEQMVRKPALRVRMGLAARERVLAEFTEARVRDGLREGYRRLMGAKN